MTNRGVTTVRHARWRSGSMVGVTLTLLGCAMVGQGAPSLDTIAQAMPQQLAGFALGDKAMRPGPALLLDYATANRSAVGSVLVFEGASPASDDPAAAVIDRELTAAVAELSEAPQGRTGRRLAEKERTTLAQDGLRCALLTGAFGRAAVVRHVCVGGAQGRFVQVQVTMAERRTSQVDATGFAAAALQAVRGAAGPAS